MNPCRADVLVILDEQIVRTLGKGVVDTDLPYAAVLPGIDHRLSIDKQAHTVVDQGVEPV